MILVAVDTSTRWAGVGVEIGSGERTEIRWHSDQNHGRELMNNIILALSKVNLEPTKITHLAVALGPGGFSAVRVGISAVLGLATPRNLPIVGVPTHLIEAIPYLRNASPQAPVVSLIPGGRGELSWARFESRDSHKPEQTGLNSVDEIIAALPANSQICGEGAVALLGRITNTQLLSGNAPTRSTESLLILARQLIEHGEVTPHAKLRPIYARPPSISKPNPPK